AVRRQEKPHRRLPRNPGRPAVAKLRLRPLRTMRHRHRAVPRLRTQQTPRLPQPTRIQSTTPTRTQGRNRRMTAPLNRRGHQAALHSSLELRLPALEVHQGPGRTIYSFAVDGKQLPLFTTVSRVHRDEGAQIQGYQRPEVLSHITAIR